MDSFSGRQIYGPKWQNEINVDAGLRPTEPNSVTHPGTASNRRSMYRAALKGNWVAAEMLLDRDPSLLSDEISEKGDRALHVAVAMKHKRFVQEVVERMSPIELKILKDGHGYTACCHAAISGTVEIAELLTRKSPNLGTARDENKVTPLQKAASRGNAEMVTHFLEFAEDKDLLDEEWFNLLLEAIRRRMYGVALKILQKNGRIATMANEEGTALHLLARQQIVFIGKRNLLGRVQWNLEGRMQQNPRLLAKMLWAEIQKLGEDNVVELMKKPPILHNAAKAGNAELITMLTRAYPDLIWHTDSDHGYTVFHIAAIYKQECVFSLIHQIGATKDLIAMTQDEKGNNILHLAGKLAPPHRRKVVPLVGLQMQREIRWFQRVEVIVPPPCLEMKNKDGDTPREVFSKEHKTLLEQSVSWMRETADSCLLVSTIFLTVVFAAAFTVPGGYDSKSGIPVLAKSFWFTCFIVSEVAALSGSILSIVHFWAIMTSSFEADQFSTELPSRLSAGLSGMMWSLLGTITAFLCAYFLVFFEGTTRFALPVGLLLYAALFLNIYLCLRSVYVTVQLPLDLSKMLSSRNTGLELL